MRGERGEVGLGLKNDEIRVDQEWPLSPSFLCLSRLRGKGEGGVLREYQEMRRK